MSNIKDIKLDELGELVIKVFEKKAVVIPTASGWIFTFDMEVLEDLYFKSMETEDNEISVFVRNPEGH